MKKNTGLKVLSLTVVGIAALVLLNSNEHKPSTLKTNDPNNLNEAIASQFNDNIRDVAARLQETEKKLTQIESENKSLQTKLYSAKNDNTNAALSKEIDALRESFNTLK